MAIIVKDETAGAVVLTIDNNGNMCFGDGTPISLLTLDGYAIIDSNGHIIHGLSSCSSNPSAGSLSVGYGERADVTTLSGRTPTVQLSTSYPSYSYYVVSQEEPDGQQGPETLESVSNGVPVHLYTPDVGLFTIANTTQATSEVQENETYQRFLNGRSDVSYVWT